MSMTSTIGQVFTLSVYNILKAEHDEVSLLFNTLEATSKVDIGRKNLFKKLRNELRSHTTAEQTAVYDKLKAKEGPENMIHHAEKEHQKVENLLNELESMDITTDAWMVKLAELKQAVDHHVREEESTMFDRMHQLFSDEQARDMGKQFVALKNAELRELKEQSS